jgi:hypothetical protein
MRRYAEDTSVSTDKSIAEIRNTVRRYRNSEFMHAEGDTQAVIMFSMHDRRVMFRVNMPDPKSKAFTHTPEQRKLRTAAAAQAAWEQACRARWRSLSLVGKAKLEALASGMTEFETEFLSNIVMPGTGVTVGEFVRKDLQLVYEQGHFVPPLPAPGGHA